MNTVATMKGERNMSKKIINISPKRQITIPQKFFKLLGFDKEAECCIRGNELVIRPAQNHGSGEFAEQILADLIAQGLSGDALLDAFKKKQAAVRPAVNAMLAEAEKAASRKGDYATYEDIFNEED